MSGEANLNRIPEFFRKKMFSSNLPQPTLLVASPHLTDNHFKRAVILVLEHHTHGAVGMIVNKPTSIRVSHAFQSPEILWAGDPQEVIWYGGPVMRESCWMLHEPLEMFATGGTIKLAPGLMVSSSVDSLQELSRNPPSRLRFIRGISGWGASQLDKEISSGMWLTTDFNSGFLFNEGPDGMWEAAYRMMGINPSHLTFNHGIH